MPLANLPDAQLAAPIVPLAPRVEAVVEPAAVTNMLNAFGAGQAVVQRAAQESLSESQALNQMDLSNRAMSMQEAQTAQNLAFNQAQMDEFLSPEQKQARRSRAIVEAIQAKELEESAPERQLLDRYTRKAAISAAIAAPGNYDKKIQAILLHGGDTSGYDPDSLLPIDPQVKRKIDQQFGEVLKYDQWQAREEAFRKESKRFVRKLINNSSGQSEDLDYYDTPEGVVSKEDYDRRVQASTMLFPQWNATPDVKEPVFGSVEALAKSRGLATAGTPAARSKPKLGEVNPETGGIVTETGQKPIEPGEDVQRKIDAVDTTLGALPEIADAFASQVENNPKWGPVRPFLGKLSAVNPYSVSDAKLAAQINAILPEAARGLFGEVGILTDQDMKRYRQLLPTSSTPVGVGQALLQVFSEKALAKGASYVDNYPTSTRVKQFAERRGFTPERMQAARQQALTESERVRAMARGDFSGNFSASATATPAGIPPHPQGWTYSRTVDGFHYYQNPANPKEYKKIPIASAVVPR